VKRCTLVVMSCLVAVSAALVTSTGVAGAGGSNWTLDRARYQPGDTAFGWAAVSWEHNPSLGTPGDGPYDAWVAPIPEAGAGPQPLIPDSAVRVAEITVSLEPYCDGPLRFGPHHAEVTFTVPDLPPGHYELLHANASGTKTLGDLTGGFFWIDVPGGGPAPAVGMSPTFTG
jgi:hypothetical protein